MVSSLRGVGGGESHNVQRAYMLARPAASVAKADIVRGADSPFGFNAIFTSDNSKYPVSYYLNMIIESGDIIGPGDTYAKTMCHWPRGNITVRDSFSR